MAEARTSSRRSYGKGYYDGLRAAGLQTGGIIMNRKKFADIYEGMTSQPRDVYDSVPIKSSYSIGQIMDDMNRRGVAQAKTVVENCLAMMTKNGIVLQDKPGFYVRQKVIEDASKKSQDEAKKQSPASILNMMAEKARQLAEELEYAAIEIEQEFQNSEAKSEQLKQLKSLLKGITD